MGEAYISMGEWEKANRYLQELKKNKFRSVYTYTCLAEVYRAKKMYQRAEEVLEEYLENYGDNLLVHLNLYFIYVVQRRFDLARAEIDKMFSIDPTNLFIPLGKGNLYYFKDELKEARKEYIKLRAFGGAQAELYGLEKLAQLNLLQGKIKKSLELILQQIDVSKKIASTYWQEFSQQIYASLLFKSRNFKLALEQFNRLWDLAVQEKNAVFSSRFKQDALLGKGLIYLESDAPGQALQAAKKLKTLTEKGMAKRDIASYYYLMGLIELKQKKFDRADGNLLKAIRIMYEVGPGVNSSDFLVMAVDHLAEAYLTYGHLEKARESYEQIISMTYARTAHGDIYAKSYYHLGSIYRQKGMQEAAVKHYKSFIHLWQDCDPEFRPLLEDARKQVDRLNPEEKGEMHIKDD